MSDEHNPDNTATPPENGRPNASDDHQVPDWVRDPARAYAEIQQLRQENASRRTSENDVLERLNGLQEIIARLVPDEEPEQQGDDPVERLESRLSSFEQALNEEREKRLAAERLATQTHLAKKYNLPDALAQRISGDDLEAMEADAKALAEIVGASGQQQNQRRTTTGVPGGQPSTDRTAEMRKRLFGAVDSNPGENVKRGRQPFWGNNS